MRPDRDLASATRRLTLESKVLPADEGAAERKREKEQEAEEREDKLRDLLRGLNGQGRIKVARATHSTHEPEYLGSWPVAGSAILESLEDFIIDAYGGGKYYVQVLTETGAYLGQGTVRIDLRQHPEKAPDKAPGAAPPASPAFDPQSLVASVTLAVTGALAPMLGKLTDVVAAQAQQKPLDPIALMTFQSAQQAQMLQSLRGLLAPAGTPAAAAAGGEQKDFLATIKEMSAVAEMLGWQRGEKNSIWEQVATASAPELIKQVGPAFAKLLSGAGEEKKPAATQPPAQPQALEAPAAKPEAAAPVKQPLRGSKPLTPEKLKAWRERQAAGGSSAPSEATPAPRAKDVAPDAVKK